MGFLIPPQLSRHVLEFSPVNERVVSLRLRAGDRSLTVVSAYGIPRMWRWKEYFKDLLNPTDTPSIEEAGAGDSEVDSFITQAEVTEVVRKRQSG